MSAPANQEKLGEQTTAEQLVYQVTYLLDKARSTDADGYSERIYTMPKTPQEGLRKLSLSRTQVVRREFRVVDEESSWGYATEAWQITKTRKLLGLPINREVETVLLSKSGPESQEDTTFLSFSSATDVLDMSYVDGIDPQFSEREFFEPGSEDYQRWLGFAQRDVNTLAEGIL